MFEQMGMALAKLADPHVMFFITVGCFIGLFVSLMPGVGDLTAVALLLPMVAGLNPEVSLSFIMGEMAVGGVAGSICAILVAIPGDGPSIVTLLDGYPMNQKGQGARAIGAAVFGSMYGAIASVAITLLLITIVRPIVISFGSAELFLMITLGLCFVIVLSGTSILKGLIAAGMGATISMIGYDPRSGIARFTFDILFLYEGISLAVLGLGLFGGAVMYETLSEGEPTISLTKKLPKLRDVLSGVKDVFHHWRVFWMSASVATVIGAIPGLGRMAAAWVTYGLTRKMCKNPEEFGTGRIEGVIAPGTSENSTAAGALLTTLSFGVPGSSTMALFLGAVIMAGLIPGPALIRDHLDMVYLLIFGIAFANIIAGTITLFTASQLAKIAFVPMDYLFPGLMTIIVVAAYVTQGSLLTMFVLIFGTVMGIAMKQFRYPVGPFVLSFVMGRLFEDYLFNALDFWGPLFFLRPICLVIMVVIFALFGGGPMLRYLKKRRARDIMDITAEAHRDITAPLNTKDNGTRLRDTHLQFKPSTYFALIIMAVMTVIIGTASTFQYRQAAVLPIIASSFVLILAGVQVVKELFGKGVIKAEKKPKTEGEIEYTKGMSFAVFAAWVLGFCLAIYVLGHVVAVAIFSLSYVKWRGRGWVKSLATSICITGLTYVLFSFAFQAELYPGFVLEAIAGG